MKFFGDLLKKGRGIHMHNEKIGPMTKVAVLLVGLGFISMAWFAWMSWCYEMADKPTPDQLALSLVVSLGSVVVYVALWLFWANRH